MIHQEEMPYCSSICTGHLWKLQDHLLKYEVQVQFKGGIILKNLLVAPKDKDTVTKKSSVVYWYKCDRIDCEDEYKRESSRS